MRFSVRVDLYNVERSQRHRFDELSRQRYRRNTTNICAKWITGQLQSWQQATGRHRQQTTGLQLSTKKVITI